MSLRRTGLLHLPLLLLAASLAGQVPSTEEHLVLGGRALANGELEAAAHHFEAALAADSDLPFAHLGLASVEERQGNLVAALRHARLAEEKAPKEPAAPAAVGRLLAQLGSTDEALEAFARARALQPDRIGAYLVPALMLRDADRGEEAIEILEAALHQGLDAPEVSSQLGFLLLAQGELERALEVGRTALRSHPEDPELMFLVGLALAPDAEGREEAIRLLESALAAGVEKRGRVQQELGGLYLDAGRTAEGIAALEEAARLLPEEPGIPYRLGTALRQSGDPEGARAALERFRELSQSQDARDHHSKEVGTALNEAQALAIQNRVPEALESVDLLLEQEPDLAAGHALRAKLLFSMGRQEEAVASIVRARELDPRRTEYHYLEGVFLLQSGNAGAAREALAGAVALDPELGEGHALLGILAARATRYEEAVTHLSKALDLGMEGADLRLHYASALQGLGRTEESQAQLEVYRALSEESRQPR